MPCLTRRADGGAVEDGGLIEIGGRGLSENAMGEGDNEHERDRENGEQRANAHGGTSRKGFIVTANGTGWGAKCNSAQTALGCGRNNGCAKDIYISTRQELESKFN